MKYELIFVEDDNQIRNGLSHFFPWEQLGFNMTASFENGMQALDYVRNHHVDVILTDVRMPVMDGLEMLEKMRLENLDAYVVILSAYREFSYAQKAIELGVSNYIIKSTKYDELVQVFQRIHENLTKGKDALVLSDALSPVEMSGELLQKIKDYIHSHIAVATLQSTADYVKYNPIYLSRLFKEKAGINFINYIIQERMQCAVELLRNPNCSICQISEAVGYSNEKNFSRAFKKYYGVGPAEYRKYL